MLNQKKFRLVQRRMKVYQHVAESPVFVISTEDEDVSARS